MKTLDDQRCPHCRTLDDRVHLDRYLSADEKRSILEDWSRKRMAAAGPEAPGGLGWPDRDIVPLCDALNALPGVCTVQSCAGHGGVDPRSPGHLWLRLSREVADRFERQACRLAGEVSVIDRVGKIYWPDGKETVVITFRGNESGLLAESGSKVFDFFRKISV